MRVLVEADGGSRGNPGVAGYGAVVRDEAGAVLAERKEYIGTATNNVAEYRGLIAGLEAARDLGAREVDVKMDSKLVVEQMSGRWKVKHPDMIPLALRAREVAAGFDRVGYQWIPRALNKDADRLANEAMDARGGELEEPEPGLRARVGTFRSASRTRSLRPEVESGGRDLESEAAEKPSAPGWTGATGRPTRLLLLRHGQTALSIENRYSGRGNPPLTDLGRDQAERSARMVAGKGGIAAVVSSPLGRALDTARASARALGLEVEVHDGLIETDFGAWEGATFREAAERYPDLHRRWLADASVLPPDGESFEQVRERIEAVRDDLVERYAGSNVLVVSHVTPIKTLLQIALGVGPSLLYRLHLDLASLSIAEFFPDGGAGVRLVNSTAHLEG